MHEIRIPPKKLVADRCFLPAGPQRETLWSVQSFFTFWGWFWRGIGLGSISRVLEEEARLGGRKENELTNTVWLSWRLVFDGSSSGHHWKYLYVKNKDSQECEPLLRIEGSKTGTSCGA